jgi:hypothetical protein
MADARPHCAACAGGKAKANMDFKHRKARCGGYIAAGYLAL